MKFNFKFNDYVNILFFGLVALFTRIYEHNLAGDNMIYAGASKNVLTSGNPLIMSIGGDVYMNKPPLMFWINSVFLYAFGTNVFAAKFASIMFTVLLMLLIFRITVKAFDEINAGYLAVLFFIINYTVFKNSQACRLESLLTLLLIISIVMAFRYMQTGKAAYLMAAGFACGLIVLTKGLLGIGFYVIILVYLLIFHRRAGAWKLLLDTGLSFAVFFVSFGWWYAYAFIKTDLYNVLVIEQSLKRASVSGGKDYSQYPVYEYLLHLVKYHFYLIPFTVIGIRKKVWRMIRHDGVRLSIFISVIYFIAIHFIATKPERYLYPLMPMLSIAAGVGLAGYVKFSMKRVVAGLYLFFLCLMTIYPAETGQPGYNVLEKTKEIADRNDLKICVDKSFRDKWEHKGALDFYFDRSDFQIGLCSEDSVNVVRRNHDCPGKILFHNKRLNVCIN